MTRLTYRQALRGAASLQQRGVDATAISLGAGLATGKSGYGIQIGERVLMTTEESSDELMKAVLAGAPMDGHRQWGSKRS